MTPPDDSFAGPGGLGGGLTHDEIAAIYRQYGHLLVRRCRAQLRDDAAADDAFQETFVKLMRHGAAFRTADSKLRWLYRVADHCCFDLGKRRRERPTAPEQLEQGGANPHPGLVTRIAARRALASLPERDRQLAWLALVDGLSQQQVAEAVGFSRQTVNQKLRAIPRTARQVARWRLILHPGAEDLEAHHVGEVVPSVAEHLPGCPTCRAYVAELDTAAARFAATADPPAFAHRIAGLVRRARDRRRSPVGRWLPVAALGAAMSWLVIAGPIRQLATTPADLTPKGGAAASLAVVVAQDGRQRRQVGTVEGRPGDRFRIELTTPQPRELQVVLVDAAGAATPVARARFAAGTTVLPATLSFRPERAIDRLLVGPPAQVARALIGEPATGVTSLQIRSVGPP